MMCEQADNKSDNYYSPILYIRSGEARSPMSKPVAQVLTRLTASVRLANIELYTQSCLSRNYYFIRVLYIFIIISLIR